MLPPILYITSFYYIGPVLDPRYSLKTCIFTWCSTLLCRPKWQKYLSELVFVSDRVKKGLPVWSTSRPRTCSPRRNWWRRMKAFRWAEQFSSTFDSYRCRAQPPHLLWHPATCLWRRRRGAGERPSVALLDYDLIFNPCSWCSTSALL